MTTRRGAIGRFRTFAAALVTLLGLAAGPARCQTPKEPPPATPPAKTDNLTQPPPMKQVAGRQGRPIGKIGPIHHWRTGGG